MKNSAVIEQSPGNALILTMSDPSGDPRPRRTYDLLEEMGFMVSTASYSIKGNLKPVEAHELVSNPPSLWRRILKKAIIAAGLVGIRLFPVRVLKEMLVSYWFGLKPLEQVLSNHKYQLLFVEDLFMLPMVFKYKDGAKVIFDAREYYPRQREDSLVFRLLERPLRLYLCKLYLKQCDQVVTVSTGLADEYAREFGIRTHVVRSTPFYSEAFVRNREDGMIRMVHHGVANRNRKIEKMVELTALLDERFSLDIYLQGNQDYINELKQLTSQNGRTRILDPVTFSAIVPTLNTYDIGLFYVEPTTFNLAYCLPNKLFEFIQARLVVAIGPSPDMAKIVNEFGCGIVADEFELQNMANHLNGLTAANITELKEKSNLAAHTLNWKVESKILQTVIENVFK